eukprot:TRINITY_DN1811_c0_g2_i1.p1 TRINITY_DN1811_c0_g2~~TRINITY_DN1811_c0_g2_i1.p1  ORF type:complete len:370 (+),score=35.30 TRINITY_DN1811_c0_g2_i1:148-1257(+)
MSENASQTAANIDKKEIHKNLVCELMMYFYVAGLFYISYTIYRVSRRKKMASKKTRLLTKLVWLNMFIGFTFLARTAVFFLRTTTFSSRNYRPLFDITKNVLEPFPEIMSVVAYCLMSYLFFTLYQDLVHFFEDNRVKMERVRRLLTTFLVSIIVLYGILALVIYFPGLKIPQDVSYELTRGYCSIVSFVAFFILHFVIKNLLACIQEICNISGKNFPTTKIKQLRFVTLICLALRAICEAGSFVFRLKRNHETMDTAVVGKGFYFTYGNIKYSTILLLWYLFVFSLELVPLFFIAYRLKPRISYNAQDSMIAEPQDVQGAPEQESSTSGIEITNCDYDERMTALPQSKTDYLILSGSRRAVKSLVKPS